MTSLVARNREIDASETAEAPGWQGAEEGEYREYLTDERRSQAGCIGGRSGIESPLQATRRRVAVALPVPVAQAAALSAIRDLRRSSIRDPGSNRTPQRSC